MYVLANFTHASYVHILGVHGRRFNVQKIGVLKARFMPFYRSRNHDRYKVSAVESIFFLILNLSMKGPRCFSSYSSSSRLWFSVGTGGPRANGPTGRKWASSHQDPLFRSAATSYFAGKISVGQTAPKLHVSDKTQNRNSYKSPPKNKQFQWTCMKGTVGPSFGEAMCSRVRHWSWTTPRWSSKLWPRLSTTLSTATTPKWAKSCPVSICFLSIVTKVDQSGQG